MIHAYDIVINLIFFAFACWIEILIVVRNNISIIVTYIVNSYILILLILTLINRNIVLQVVLLILWIELLLFIFLVDIRVQVNFDIVEDSRIAPILRLLLVELYLLCNLRGLFKVLINSHSHFLCPFVIRPLSFLFLLSAVRYSSELVVWGLIDLLLPLNILALHLAHLFISDVSQMLQYLVSLIV